MCSDVWALMPQDNQGPSEDDCVYVIDGGALHRIPWQKGSTYDSICKKYTDYVIHHYGRDVNVFDGYANGPGSK